MKYQWTAPISIKSIILNPKLYISILLMIVSQVALSLVPISEMYPDKSLWFKITSALIVIVICVWTLYQIDHREYIINDPKPKILTIIKGFGLIVLGLVIATAYMVIVQPESTSSTNQEAINQMLANNKILMGVMLIFMAPIIEEYIFRELLPRVFGLSIVAFIVSSAIFIMLHSPNNITGFIMYTSITISLTYARIKDQNVKSSIVLHMIWNTFSYIISIVSIT